MSVSPRKLLLCWVIEHAQGNPGNPGNPGHPDGSSRLLQETSQRDFLKSVSEFRAAGYEFLGFSVSDGTYRALVYLVGGYVPRGLTEPEFKSIVMGWMNIRTVSGHARIGNILKQIRERRLTPEQAVSMFGAIGEEAEMISLYAEADDEQLDKLIRINKELEGSYVGAAERLEEMKGKLMYK